MNDPAAPGGRTEAWLEGLPDAACLVAGADLEIVAANGAFARLVGMPAGELAGRPIAPFAATPQDLALWDEVREHANRDAGGAEPPAAWPAGHAREHDTLMLAGGVDERPLSLRVTRLDEGPRGGRWLVALRDRTDEVRLRSALDEKVAELQATMESTADGLLVTDLAGRILNFNRRFAALWHLPDELLHRHDDAAVREWMGARVADGAAWGALQERWSASGLAESTDLVALQGGEVLEVASRPRLWAGSPVGRVTAFRDLTERQRSLDEIRRLSHTDMLTGLPNRRDFAATLSARLAAAATHGRGAALLIVNLDRFRTVDESLGTAAADRVLVETARRLRRIVEPDDLLARLSGDEFALALWDADAAHAESAARRVLAALAPAYEVAGTRFSITASVGIALAPTDGDELEVLLRSAAAAMRRAKDAGRATVRFHQPRRNVDLRERLELDHAMRQGLPAGHFRIEVQPQFDLASGALAGVEALARWRDPQLGEIGPGRFIPVAEDSGFIVELGQWVLDEAVRCAASWWRSGAPVPIAVNVSALQFRHPDFVDRVARSLDTAGLPARGLELELTESILVGEGCEALPRLQELAALGVTLALDDFGTGYSNLSVLKRLPISRLKIDRSFVAALPDAGSDAAIVDAISAMARALRMTVVAEGVETEAQRAFLHRVGCQVMQGYLKARPLPVADFVARWQAGEWVAAGPAGDAATLAVPAPRVLGSGAFARAGHSVQVRRRSPGRRLGLVPRV